MPTLPPPFTRDELLDSFETEWLALMQVVEAANPDDLLAKTDAGGWNVRDHLANLSAWLESVIVMVRDGQPQWTGLGAPEKLFGYADYDPLNEAIRQNTIDWPVSDVLAQLRARHDEMIGLVSAMSDEDLLRPVKEFVAGAGDFAICYKIDGNGPHHYREHRPWIEAILAAEQPDEA